MTPEELEAERLRLQAESNTNPMMQPTDLMGQEAPQEDVNPIALAGLGGAAAFQGMFPLAGDAAANSRGTTLPQLMGSGNSQFTGANAGRLAQGTQIVPQTQEAITNPQLQFSGSQPNQVSSPEPAVTTPADEGGFFSPGGFGYEYLGGRLGENIGQFIGEQKYGTGLDAEGEVTGRPLNPRGLPGQTATLAASTLELLDDYGIDPVVTAGKVLPEYLTGLDLTDSSLIETPKTEVQPTSPEIPQGAPGSPQAFFEEYRSKGPLTPEQIARGEAVAARMNRTFNPDTGFSQTPAQPGVATPVTSGLVTQSGIPLSEFLSGAAIPSAGLRAESPMYADNSVSRGLTGDAGRAAFDAASAEREARLAASMQQPGESITERDTRNAAARTTGTSTTGPRTYGGYTTAQLRGMVGGGDDLRAAQMRAEAGLNPITGNREKTEEERAQSSEQGQLQNQALQARIDVLKQGNPDKVKEAQDAAAKLGLEGRAATIFILGEMKINTETIFEILEASKQGGGGGGGQSHAALNAAAKNSGQSTYVGPDGQTYDVQ